MDLNDTTEQHPQRQQIQRYQDALDEANACAAYWAALATQREAELRCLRALVGGNIHRAVLEDSVRHRTN